MAMAATTTLPQRIGALPVVRKLKRSNGKRVSWASADQLCQIRMFLAEDAPFLAGVAQEQLQVKSSSFMHMLADLPPGFGGAFGRVGAPPSKINSTAAAPAIEALVANVAPAIPWQCPQKVELDPSWRVEAGEESVEVAAQKQRESTTLEALYPRSSAIPNSPVEPLDQGMLVDERSIPAIPVTAPDEDSDGEEAPQVGTSGAKAVMGLNAAVAAAAGVQALNRSGGYYGPGSGAMSEISSEKELSSSSSGGIDTNLLLQLLANPSLVATLSGLQQQNQSMVNSPNGNLVNQAAIVGCSAGNLTSLTTSISSAAAAATTPNVSSSVSSSSWLQAPEAAAAAAAVYQPQFHQQLQQQKPVLQAQAQQQQQKMGSVPPGFQQQQFMLQQQQQQPGGRSREDEKYYKELIMQHGGAGGGFGQPGTVHQQQPHRGGGAQHHQQQQNYRQEHHRHQHHQQQQSHKKNGYNHPPGFGGVLAETNGSGGGGGGGGGGPRGRKVCAYYNTPKGCRNGMKCPFIHDPNKRGRDETIHQQQHKRMRGGLMQQAAAAAVPAAAGSDGERF